jgi:hypothetical protein
MGLVRGTWNGVSRGLGGLTSVTLTWVMTLIMPRENVDFGLLIFQVVVALIGSLAIVASSKKTEQPCSSPSRKACARRVDSD